MVRKINVLFMVFVVVVGANFVSRLAALELIINNNDTLQIRVVVKDEAEELLVDEILAPHATVPVEVGAAAKILIDIRSVETNQGGAPVISETYMVREKEGMFFLSHKERRFRLVSAPRHSGKKLHMCL